MLYVTFCYAPDAAMLGMVCARIRELDPEAIIYAVSDPAAPLTAADVPEGVHHRQGAVRRGGNLNGLPIVAEELTVFRSLMDQHNAQHIVKFDSDMYPRTLAPYRDAPAEVGMVGSERWQAFVPAGYVYRLSSEMVDALQAEYNTRTEGGLWTGGQNYPEDTTLWGLAACCGVRLMLLSYGSGYSAGMPDCLPHELPEHVRKAATVHCGEPMPDGTRVSRPHATLRMRILQEAIKNYAKP